MIRIKMMGEFVITVNGTESKPLVVRSRKGVALMGYLILNRGKYVPKQRLLNILWSDYLHVNPENALKTLVSRIRKILNDISSGLGECILSERGGYRWQSLPDMQIDVLLIMDIYEKLAREKSSPLRISLYEQLMKLYTGDLFLTGDIDGGSGYEAALHNEYLSAIYDYIELLTKEEKYSKIIEVCRRALQIDEVDDRLHMEMMQAQVSSNRIDEAMEQYRKMTNINQRYLDSEPSEEIMDFYQKIVSSSNYLKYNLETVREDLNQFEHSTGAYICEYDTFKIIFNIMRPTLERLGCTMFVGMITLFGQDDLEAGSQLLEQAVDKLLEIMRINLRRGDLVMRYAPNVAVALLPSVNHTTGNMVMERIRYTFQTQYPSSEIPFHYRLGDLGNI